MRQGSLSGSFGEAALSKMIPAVVGTAEGEDSLDDVLELHLR